MKSLLLKDLLNLRGYVKIITFFVVFYGLITFTMDDLNFLSGMVIILFMMIPISSFNYDQHSKWDVFSQALPVSRKEIVQSKYVLGCLFLVVGFTVSFLMSAIVSIIKYSSVEWKDMFVTNAMIVVVGIIFLAILLPLIYKFGVDKSRILMMIIFAVPMITVIVLSNLGIQIPANLNENMFLYILPVIAFVCIIVSYFFSVKIYCAKDF